MATLVVLGLLDIMAGIMLSAGGLPYLPGNGFVVTIGSIMLIKGAWFFMTGVGKGRGKMLKDVSEGGLDFVSGMLLAMVYSGTFLSLFAIPGILMIIKGAWYFFEGLTQ